MATDGTNQGSGSRTGDRMVPSAYSRRHYLLFGQAPGAVYNKLLDTAATASYLSSCGLGEGELTRARTERARGTYLRRNDLGSATERYCDFCGKPLTGVEYQRLHDGRDRCTECSRTVVSGRTALEDLLSSVKADLQEKFSITINREISIKVVSQDKISRALGVSWKPTTGYDPRAIGFVHKGYLRQQLWLENGAPRLPLISTIAHELTHIWQHENWDEDGLRKLYGESYKEIVEGMAEWVEVQYLFLINEAHLAERTLEHESGRDDVYGRGLGLYLRQYPISHTIMLEGETPFRNAGQPIDPSLLTTEQA